MPVRELEALFRPKGVAVVAEGEAPLARVAARNLAAGYGGVVHKVEASALPALASVPELVLIAAGAERLPDLVAQAGAGGAKAVLLLGPHAEPGGDTPFRLRAAARKTGLRVVGPGSLGVAVPGKRFFAGAFHRLPPAGRVALVAQSGTLAGAAIDWAARRDVGFSHIAVLGDGADVGVAELLDYLSAQGDCQAVLLVLDTVGVARGGDARRFLSAARAAARLKPVILLRTGGAEAGDSAEEDAVFDAAVFDAAIRRAGLLRVSALDELFDALEMLAVSIPVRGDRLAVVANGRGIGRLARDALVETGLEAGLGGGVPGAGVPGRLATPAELPNPLDLGEGAPGAAYAQALARLGADKGVDAILLLHAPTALVPAGEVARTVAGSIVSGTHPPVLTSWLGERDSDHATAELARHRVPVFDTPDRAVRAFRNALTFRRNQDLLTETPPSVPEDFVPDAAAARRVVEDAVAAGRRVLSREEARALFGAFGVPVVEVEAFAGHDLAVGIREDARYGPVLTVGHRSPRFPGETAVALPPLNMALAREALMRVPAVRLALEEGLDAAGFDSAALLLVKTAQLVADVEELAGLSLGPVRVGAHGVRVGGAEVRLVRRGQTRAPFAIRPYPKHLEQALPLPDGRSFLIRPLVPEDEPALKALFKRLTPSEIRLRFFTQKQELTHSVAARMTQLDYDREMGLAVAERGRPGVAAVHGVVHLAATPDGERAEFAIMVAHDMAGLGFGPVLMRRIIDYARASGLHEIFGEVLHENRPMLRLCELFGFVRHMQRDDPGVAHLTLSLHPPVNGQGI